MNLTTHHAPGTASAGPGGVIRTSRRRLPALLAALLAAVGLHTPAFQDLAAAKKQGNGKHNKNKKKRKGKKKGKGGCTPRDASYAPDGEERDLVDLINAFRRDNGQDELAIHEQLSAAAKHHSQDMANKNYFSHKLANGVTPGENIRCHGYRYRAYGENIAAGHEGASDTFEQWRKSDGHRRIMLDPDFTEIGIGRAHNGKAKYDWYWTGTFGSR